MGVKANRSLLLQAVEDGALTRFNHRYENTRVGGYVLAVGPVFFLVCTVSDRMWFDGFECFRIADVSHIQPNPHAAFVERALELRGQLRPARPDIDLASVDRILATAGRASPLVTICVEEIDPDVCYIGRVVAIGGESVTLHEIDPDAVWETSPTEYALADITRVAFGQDYEGALHLVGGEPPAL